MGQIREEAKSRVRQMTLLPPAPEVCQTCAGKHDPGEPHNKKSIYYQMKFNAEHGRWPTWTDAMSHCTEETKEAWTRELLSHGEEI